MIALLTAGSAISLISCGGGAKTEEAGDEGLISRTVDNMEIVTTDNGKTASLMRAPLMEDHAFAKAAFTEYRQGIEYISYNDSTGLQSMHVVADYALHWTARDLYELKGNVVVTGEKGQRLYTQQLMWDRKIEKIYSNVDSKVEDGADIIIGTGFDAVDDFSSWKFREITGIVGVDTEPTGQPAGGEGAAGSDGQTPASGEEAVRPSDNEPVVEANPAGDGLRRPATGPPRPDRLRPMLRDSTQKPIPIEP